MAAAACRPELVADLLLVRRSFNRWLIPNAAAAARWPQLKLDRLLDELELPLWVFAPCPCASTSELRTGAATLFLNTLPALRPNELG